MNLNEPVEDLPEDLWYTTWAPISHLICESAMYAELLQSSHALPRRPSYYLDYTAALKIKRAIHLD